MDKEDESLPIEMLPPEVRRMVWKSYFCLLSPMKIRVASIPGEQKPSYQPPYNLLLVSKALRAEAIDLYFRYTEFDVGSLDKLVALLSSIGTAGRGRIRAISFDWCGGVEFDPDAAKALLRTCSKLDLLTIYSGTRVRDPGFSEIRDVLKAWELDHVKVEWKLPSRSGRFIPYFCFMSTSGLGNDTAFSGFEH